MHDENAEGYNEEYLLSVWDNITLEYDKLTKRYEFTRALNDTKDNLIEINRMVGIKSAYYLAVFGKYEAVEMLKYWNVDIPDISTKSILKLRSIIAQENTRLTIESWRQQGVIKASKGEGMDIVKAMVQAQNVLSRTFDIQKTTVAEWVYICQDVNSIIARNIKKNGRN